MAFSPTILESIIGANSCVTNRDVGNGFFRQVGKMGEPLRKSNKEMQATTSIALLSKQRRARELDQKIVADHPRSAVSTG